MCSVHPLGRPTHKGWWASRGLRGVRRAAVALVAVLVAALAVGGRPSTENGSLASAVRPQDVPQQRRSISGLYVTAREAHAALQRDTKVLLIDVRTYGETVFSGVAAPMHRHVPYMLLDGDHAYDVEQKRYRLSVNPEFAKAFEQLFADYKLDRNAPVILYCSTGERSAKAASYLAQIGYERIYSMVDGFEENATGVGALGVGWKRSGLPWTAELTEAQTYKSPSM